MNILIIGSGGREHAFYTKLKEDNLDNNVYMLGINGGVCEQELILNADPLNFEQVYQKINQLEIELTIVGPEAPLENGIVDFLESKNCNVIGPTKYCAQLECSKVFAKKMMDKAKIATAKFEYVTTVSDGLKCADKFGYPIVMKYDGLAAGKGVQICQTKAEAQLFLEQVLINKHLGNAGVLIEECLIGEEFSVFAYVNGESYCLLPTVQDYKRVYDFDQGLNTGGMGANTTSKYNCELKHIENEILKPLLKEFRMQGNNYTGFLYLGLMATENGIKVIEFNVRMGDPETQLVLQKIDDKLLDIFKRVNSGETYYCKVKPTEYVGVVLAADGYPKTYVKNVILEINKSMQPIYHMGTQKINGVLTSTGGRVLMVTSSGNSVADARDNVYKKLENFNNNDLFYRTDIGLDRT